MFLESEMDILITSVPGMEDFLRRRDLPGYMVGWAPQEEVLKHQAIGGFWTHSGWKTLESIVAGVPMMCWSYFADQMVNSRLVSEVWKLGFDMKDTCDRTVCLEKQNTQNARINNAASQCSSSQNDLT
ncbi:unnamed protein product [Prunus brigantina]